MARPEDEESGSRQSSVSQTPGAFTDTRSASGEPVARLAPAPASVARSAPPLLLPAVLLERYEGISLLGRGGMGVVYRARDLRLGRDVALKLLFDDEGSARLLREARAQARVEHEHACKIYEVGVEEGARYISMQYVAGEPLDRAAPGMSLEARVRVVRQVASALHEAHRIGLVHRDVKPSNVLVERGEDGAYRPYLTDFGIAREAGAAGPTLTGAIAGTPAFMAPEQASGEVRSLDRRTDVYSLGATLYAVVAGRPPFTAPDAWTLLKRIRTEDAPPLGRAAPGTPPNLEAVVARCLERDPGRRYPSAKALGEDLQRFLDGDPVEARRLSLAYLVLRKARRYRGRVALAMAALAAAALLVGLWIQDRGLATRRAELSRELGEDVKEMELFLRTAYGLPLHDVERERDVVRERLRGVEARMARAGTAGVGPGHYALGRGYLALQEPDAALAQLKLASAAGYAAPELDYAMGLTLGELYDRAVVTAKRIDDAERRKARLAVLSAEYRAPALVHLRAALGARLEAPAYVEGLIALREDRPEEALEEARAAFAQVPWLYEAKTLEGDARAAMGRPFGADAAFDYEKMMVDYRAAAEAYRAAGDVARSDPRVHEASCRLWAQIMLASSARPETRRPSHEEAAAACGRAMAASSRSVSARIERAFVQGQYAWQIIGEEDPGPAIDEAISLGTEAARLSPGDPMAPYVVASGERARGRDLYLRGLDSRAATGRAVTAFRAAIRLDPTFVWARNDLAGTYVAQGMAEGLRGLDPTASYELAVEESTGAAALDPRSVREPMIAAAALFSEAENLVERGRDPAAVIARARAAIASGLAVAPDWADAWYDSAVLAWIEARYEVAVGRDPEAALARGEASAAEEVRRSSGEAEVDEMLGKLATIRALARLEAGGDPGPALAVARACFQRVLKLTPRDVEILVWQARAELSGLRWAARSREVDADAAGAAMAPLLALVATEQADPRPAEALAEIFEVVATSLAARGRPADDAIAGGLSRAAEALARNPHLGPALAARGGLLLARARTAKSALERRAAAREAVEAFSAAMREDPLLGRRWGPLLRAAEEARGP